MSTMLNKMIHESDINYSLNHRAKSKYLDAYKPKQDIPDLNSIHPIPKSQISRPQTSSPNQFKEKK
jgi:hypothetical protein